MNKRLTARFDRRSVNPAQPEKRKSEANFCFTLKNLRLKCTPKYSFIINNARVIFSANNGVYFSWKNAVCTSTCFFKWKLRRIVREYRSVHAVQVA